MKNLLLLPFCLLFFFNLNAQPFVQQLVKVDFENNNALTLLATIDNSFWPEREYCYDSVNGQFIFTAIGATFEQSLFTVDVANGAILSEVQHPAYNNPQGQASYEFHTVNQNIYSIVPANTNGSGIDFVQVDASTGVYTNLNNLSAGGDWNTTHSTIDPSTNTYFLSTYIDKQIMRINTNNGQIVFTTTYADNMSLRHLEFDVTSNKLVGLAKFDGDNFISLIDIDPRTLEVTNPRLITGLTNTISNLTQGAGTIAYDSNNQRYFVIGFNDNSELKLYVIDGASAAVLYTNDYENPPEFPYFMERHSIEKIVYDTKNDQLLGLYRDELLATSTSDLNSEIKLEIFPNPAVDFVNVRWESAKMTSIALYNQKGQELILKTECEGSEFCTLDLRNLPKGVLQLLISFEDHPNVMRSIMR